MSRIASVKETGEELSQAEWERFEQAVETAVQRRPKSEPREHDAEPRSDASRLDGDKPAG